MSTTTTPTLGSRLRAAREARGWSVARLAAETGLTIAGIEDCEHSHLIPKKAYISQRAFWEKLGRIAVALRIDLSSLFKD